MEFPIPKRKERLEAVNNLLPKKLVDVLSVFEQPKFMVTKNDNNEPNIAFVTSWTHYEGNKLVYGDFLNYKTRKNLESGHNELGLLIMTTDLDNWAIKATFESFHRNDEIYEFIAMTPLFRYNQYTNARGAGVAEAIWVGENLKLSKLSVLSSFLKARFARKRVPRTETEEGNMPQNVFKRMDAMTAVKAISFIDDDGYPVAFPNLGIVPAGQNSLVVNRSEEYRRGFHIQSGLRVAISLVTTEPAAFQLKGTYREIDESTAYVELDRVYACSLPRPGVRVDIPMLRPEG
jgi:hypothetical protein